MTDIRLIQNEYGQVYYFHGDTPPAGCVWMPPDIGPCRVMGEWKEPVVEVEKVARTGEGDGKIRCEVYTRCVGYIRPKSQFNRGKLQEVNERKPYNVAKALAHG